jgi:DNA-nicking Smr family endonuclease
MAAKKKKSQAKPAKKKETPFNAPFAGLKKAVDLAARQDESAPATAGRSPIPSEEPNPEHLFSRAMQGVRPLDDSKGPDLPRRPEAKPPLLDQQPDEDLEVLAHLADLVSGQEQMDLRFLDGYVRGSRHGVSEELMERLAQGRFPIQDYLDLHGFGLEEAFSACEKFLVAAQTRGLRHVLLVHGKGLNSPDGVAVIKNALAKWLGQKRLGRRVLAFCTAQPHDGGMGATYVLLRKWS